MNAHQCCVISMLVSKSIVTDQPTHFWHMNWRKIVSCQTLTLFWQFTNMTEILWHVSDTSQMVPTKIFIEACLMTCPLNLNIKLQTIVGPNQEHVIYNCCNLYIAFMHQNFLVALFNVIPVKRLTLTSNCITNAYMSFLCSSLILTNFQKWIWPNGFVGDVKSWCVSWMTDTNDTNSISVTHQKNAPKVPNFKIK